MKSTLKTFLCGIMLPFLTGEGWRVGCYAQDFHLSQVDAAPHYFNPALTGIYFEQDVQYKIYSDYRSQWKALGIRPFSTYYLAYDMPYKKFGLGGYLIHNRNGKGGLNTFNLMPSASYKITDELASPHNLSVGLQLGILYRSFDPSQFTYQTQFSPDAPGGFDANIPSGENFAKTSLLKIDANMGVFYKYKEEAWQVHPWGGFSVNHITRPKQSMSTIFKDRLPIRWVFQAGADWKINEKFKAIPMLLYMNQAKASEINVGALSSYLIEENKYDALFGLHYRWKDALVVRVGMKYEDHIVTFSYDINTSYLSNYTKGRGAFEISVVLSKMQGKPFFTPKFGRNESMFKPL